MHLQYKRLLFIFLLLFLVQGFTHAQELDVPRHTGVTIPAQKWQQLTSDKDFGYKNDVEKEEKPVENKPGLLSEFISALFRFFGNGVGSVILYAAAFVVVVFILYKLGTSKGTFIFTRNRKKMARAQGDETEDLSATNWEAQLQKAVQQNDLRMAVRYSYMWLLHMLNDRQLIKYSDDKTNYEYYRELESSPHKQSFKLLSRQYEYSNYGNYELTPSAYNNYIEVFNNLRKTLGQ